MTAKELLIELVDGFTEAEAVDALRSLDEWEAARVGKVYPSPDTSAEAINRRLGLSPVSAEVFEQHFGDLPTEDQG